MCNCTDKWSQWKEELKKDAVLRLCIVLNNRPITQNFYVNKRLCEWKLDSLAKWNSRKPQIGFDWSGVWIAVPQTEVVKVAQKLFMQTYFYEVVFVYYYDDFNFHIFISELFLNNYYFDVLRPLLKSVKKILFVSKIFKDQLLQTLHVHISLLSFQPLCFKLYFNM